MFIGTRTNEVFALTAYYPFNSNANDESGYGHNGAVSNAVLSNDRFGSDSSAYYFNGANSLIYVNHRLSTNNRFTLMFWIKDDSSGIYHRRWISTTAGVINASTFVVREEPDCGSVQLFCGLDYYYSTNTITNIYFWKDGNWHFIAVVADGSVTSVYYDCTNLITANDSVVPENGIYIGGYYDLGLSEYFLGSMDDIRIFNGPLTLSEIQSYFHENGW